MEIKRGLRDKLEKYINVDNHISVSMKTVGKAEYDYCCFGVDANGKLSDDRYMVFYNQPQTPKNEIAYSAKNGYRHGKRVRRVLSLPYSSKLSRGILHPLRRRRHGKILPHQVSRKIGGFVPLPHNGKLQKVGKRRATYCQPGNGYFGRVGYCCAIAHYLRKRHG